MGLAAMGMEPKALASMGMDPKAMAAMMDPKAMAAMMDPKAAMGMDPKTMAAMGMDPKTMAAMGMDPKMMAAMMDPKAMAAMMDPKALAGMDPKALASLGIDPKMLAGMDPKMLASLGMDPKMMSDPNLMAVYAMGMPGMMPPMSSAAASSLSNGIGSSAGTPLPSSKSGTAKPKPGTVAAALQEKKESEKRGDVVVENHDTKNHDRSLDENDEDFRKGLTSEERVLLREKKKERLMKENENDSDEGLNLSVSKNGGSEHPTKLEALLAKPIDDLPHHSEKGLSAEPPRP